MSTGIPDVFQVFAENSLIKNKFKEEKKNGKKNMNSFWKILPY